MPDTAKADARAAEPQPTQGSTPETPEERRFSVEELMERARSSLQVSPLAIAGALASERAKTFTLEQAEKKVNSYLKREVETDTVEEAA